MDYLLSIDYMHFYYAAIVALLAAGWCFKRNFSIINDINSSTQTNFIVDNTEFIHPELKSAKSSVDLYSFFGVLFAGITLAIGLIGFIGHIEQQVERLFNSIKWESAHEREFVTTGQFKDGVQIEIKYDLIIKFPDGYQLQKLKDHFSTLELLFDGYIKPQLYIITQGSTVDRFAYEAYETKRGEFTEYIRNQVLNGIDPKMGFRSVDGYKSFKSLGIEITVSMIHYTFDPLFLKNIEHKFEIAKGEAYGAMKGKTDKLMKEWIEEGRNKKN